MSLATAFVRYSDLLTYRGHSLGMLFYRQVVRSERAYRFCKACSNPCWSGQVLEWIFNDFTGEDRRLDGSAAAMTALAHMLLLRLPVYVLSQNSPRLAVVLSLSLSRHAAGLELWLH